MAPTSLLKVMKNIKYIKFSTTPCVWYSQCKQTNRCSMDATTHSPQDSAWYPNIRLGFETENFGMISWNKGQIIRILLFYEFLETFLKQEPLKFYSHKWARFNVWLCYCQYYMSQRNDHIINSHQQIRKNALWWK